MKSLKVNNCKSSSIIYSCIYICNINIIIITIYVYREIQELKAMQDKLRQELKAIDGSTNEATVSPTTSDSDVVSVSGKNKGVSLYKNTLTPSTAIHGYKTSSNTSTSIHNNNYNTTTNHQKDIYKVVPHEDTPTYDHINMRHSYTGGGIGSAYMNSSSSSSYVDNTMAVHNRDNSYTNLPYTRGHAASTVTLPYSSGDKYRSKYTNSNNSSKYTNNNDNDSSKYTNNNNDIHYPPPLHVVSIPSVVTNNIKFPTPSSALQGSVLNLISSPTSYTTNTTTAAAKLHSTTNNNSTTTPSSPSRYRYKQPHTATTTTATKTLLNNNSSSSHTKAHHRNTHTSLQQISPKQVQVSPSAAAVVVGTNKSHQNATNTSTVSGSIVGVVGVQTHSTTSPVTKLTSPTSIMGEKPPLTFLTAVNSLSDNSHVSNNSKSSYYSNSSNNSNDSGDTAQADHEDIDDVDSSIECDVNMKVSSYRYDNNNDAGASDISISDKDII